MKMGDDTSFPQMGEERCGSRNPTCFLLIWLQCFPFCCSFCFFFYDPERSLEQSVEREKKEREFIVFQGLLLQNFASISAVPIRKVKNQQACIVRIWQERQCTKKKLKKKLIFFLYLEFFFGFYVQSINFFPRSSKGPKNSSKIIDI